MSSRLLTFGVLLAVLTAWPSAAKARGCAALATSAGQAASQGVPAKPVPGSGAHGLNLANLDRSASPCQDFFQFADGGWIHSHSIPDGKLSWSLLDELRARSQEFLWQILEQEAGARAHARPGSADQALGDFYAGCMDAKTKDAASWKPLDPELRRIAALGNLGDLASEVAHLQEIGVRPLFGFGAAPDYSDPAQIIGRAYPAGLGLPRREDYLQEDGDFQQFRQEYLIHIGRMFRLLGERPAHARADAQAVLRIETGLARAANGRIANGDPEAAFRRMNAQQLQALTPHFSWSRYFQALGIPPNGPVELMRPAYFQAMDRELAAFPLADWKIYLRWQLIHAAAPDLSRPFVDENFDFYGRTLAGDSQIEPQWQRCVEAADRELRQPLDRKYIEATFSPAAKPAAQALVHGLVAAFRQDLQKLYWLGPAARAAALAKLDTLKIHVGYPDKWPTAPVFRVTTGPFIENVLRGNRSRFRLAMARIGKPASRSRWLIPVSSVDPIYDPSLNEIFLPAGLLQPPLFDPQADDALNYGGIGAIVGHEMTHGFDEQGSRFDAHGNLRDWWAPEDREGFHQIADCVANQYSTYVAVDNLHENGHLVLAESMADIGGLAIAYKAFEKTPEFRSRHKIQGFTPQQRFFLAYARVWAEKEDAQHILDMLRVNPHATARYRVIGPLSDFEPFLRAFRCPNGSPMFRPEPDRCAIW